MQRFVISKNEDGSLTVVLLVSIVVAGLLLVMFGQVRTIQQTVRGDRDFNASIQVADAGLQSAFTHITSADPTTLPPVGSILTSTSLETDPSVGGGDFTWQAFRRSEREWELRAMGEFRGSQRFVEATFGPRQLFLTALYGPAGLDGNFPANTNANEPNWHSSLGIATGLGAYDSVSGEVLTGKVAIAAGTSDAGACSFKPSPAGLDTVMFGDGSLSGCEERGEAIPELPDLGQDAFDPGGLCHAETSDPTVTIETTYSGAFVRGTTYCLETIHFPSSHQVLVSGVGSEPVHVYVRRSMTMDGVGKSSRKLINVDPDDGPPNASDLVLYFAGDGETVETEKRNHTWFAASIYAPNRACEFGTQTILYGAAVCNTINIQGGGGFRFFYDISTADIYQDEKTVIQGWREEYERSSGFGWVG